MNLNICCLNEARQKVFKEYEYIYIKFWKISMSLYLTQTANHCLVMEAQREQDGFQRGTGILLVVMDIVSTRVPLEKQNQ